MIRPDRKGNLRSSGIVGLSDQEDTPVVFTHTVGMKQQQSSYTSWTTKEKLKSTKSANPRQTAHARYAN